MPNTSRRPVLLAVTTSSRVEDVNLYTDLIAAALHDEGATVRTGGHDYAVEVLTAPHGAPDTVDGTNPSQVRAQSAARGTALADLYRAALLDLDDTTGTLASMVTDLLHLADARGDTSAADVLAAATAHYDADQTGGW